MVVEDADTAGRYVESPLRLLFEGGGGVGASRLIDHVMKAVMTKRYQFLLLY